MSLSLFKVLHQVCLYQLLTGSVALNQVFVAVEAFYLRQRRAHRPVWGIILTPENLRNAYRHQEWKSK